MSNVTQNLEPNNVFYFFEKISEIPRGSKKEKQISDWLVNFAKERNLEVYQDEFFNVVIKKNATEGYEEYSPIILQGHIDMVWEKNSSTDFNFETQGIQLEVNENILKAKGTTLGADNGIAVAIALAILDSNNLKHPKLEVLFTSDEEAGMSGAHNFNASILQGKSMLNIDTEEDDSICVSCAGGLRGEIKFPIIHTEQAFDTYIEVSITGLNGGHSGTDIHKGLGNSNKILFEILGEVMNHHEIMISFVSGGEKDNAIPREARAIINVNSFDLDSIKEKIYNKYNEIKYRISNIDPNLSIELSKIILDYDTFKGSLDKENSRQFVNFMNEFPNGVKTMSRQIDGLVESSLSLGVVRTFEDYIVIKTLMRSSSKEAQDNITNEVENLVKKYNSQISYADASPLWEYKEISPLRDLFLKTHRETFGNDVNVGSVHAGLECGILVDKIPNLDVISIGPNIHGAHTPEESLEIGSTQKIWNWIVKSLEEYNIK